MGCTKDHEAEKEEEVKEAKQELIDPPADPKGVNSEGKPCGNKDPKNPKRAKGGTHIAEKIGGAGTPVRQGIKVGGKKGGRAVQKGTTAATQAGRAQVAKARQGNVKKMIGTGRAEKAGALVGGLAGGLAGVAIPDGPAMVAGEIAGGYVGAKAGGKIGRQIDKIGAKKPVTTTEAIERQAKDRKKLSQPHATPGNRREHDHDVDSAMTDYLPRKGKGRMRPASKKEMRVSAMREDKAFDNVVGKLRKKYGKDAVLTKDSPKPKAQPKPKAKPQKPLTDKEKAHREVVARYGGEANYKAGRGLGT